MLHKSVCVWHNLLYFQFCKVVYLAVDIKWVGPQNIKSGIVSIYLCRKSSVKSSSVNDLTYMKFGVKTLTWREVVGWGRRVLIGCLSYDFDSTSHSTNKIILYRIVDFIYIQVISFIRHCYICPLYLMVDRCNTYTARRVCVIKKKGGGLMIIHASVLIVLNPHTGVWLVASYPRDMFFLLT